MTLLESLQNDLKEAQLARDEVKVSILRFLLAQISNAKIAKGSDLTDEDIISEVSKEIKRHKESIEAFKKGNREDLVEKETKELKILEAYQPDQLSADQLNKLVDVAISKCNASTISDMGKVMGILMPSVKGRADGAQVLNIVKSKLDSFGG